MSGRARVLTVLGILAAVAAGVVGVGLVAWRRFQAHQIARESHTVVEAIRKVARLSTVEMNVSSFQLKKDAKNLLGFIPIRCEKTVAIFYKGRVAAGFDFQDSGGIKLTTVPGTRRLLVQLPPARLLYTDAPPPEVVVADGSLCNRLEAADYQTLTAEARGALEREALSAGILRQAETHARELVDSVAGPLGFQVEVRIAPGPTSLSTSALR
jgi:hypothetical protein